MTRHQRQTELNNVIADRIKQAACKAFYIYHLKATTRGTVIKTLEK